jgi:hypothetical protein
LKALRYVRADRRGGDFARAAIHEAFQLARVEQFVQARDAASKHPARLLWLHYERTELNVGKPRAAYGHWCCPTFYGERWHITAEKVLGTRIRRNARNAGAASKSVGSPQNGVVAHSQERNILPLTVLLQPFDHLLAKRSVR